MYVWGVPVCVIGSASVYWTLIYTGVNPTAASYGLSVESGAAGFFVLSYALYCMLLPICRNAGNIDAALAKRTYEDAKKELAYDWFNTNPIRVLLSIYDPDPDETPLIYYQRGKEYLQGGAEYLNPDGTLNIPSVHGDIGKMLGKVKNMGDKVKNMGDKFHGSMKRGVTKLKPKKASCCAGPDDDVELDDMNYREKEGLLTDDDEEFEYEDE
jgi:hypothetical protein